MNSIPAKGPVTVAKILQAENRKDLRNKTMLDKEVFTKQEIKAL